MSIAPPCERLAERMPEILDDPDLLGPADADHVAHCLACQAEMARYRRLRRILTGMGSELAPADPDLLDGILDGLDTAAERRARRDRQRTAGLRAASLVGLAAATAAGVGGVLVLATRRRSA